MQVKKSLIQFVFNFRMLPHPHHVPIVVIISVSVSVALIATAVVLAGYFTNWFNLVSDVSESGPSGDSVGESIGESGPSGDSVGESIGESGPSGEMALDDLVNDVLGGDTESGLSGEVVNDVGAPVDVPTDDQTDLPSKILVSVATDFYTAYTQEPFTWIESEMADIQFYGSDITIPASDMFAQWVGPTNRISVLPNVTDTGAGIVTDGGAYLWAYSNSLNNINYYTTSDTLDLSQASGEWINPTSSDAPTVTLELPE